MNKIFAFTVLLVGLTSSVCFATQVQLSYIPGNLWATTVSDTTTASGMTYLRGTAQPQTDIAGNGFFSTSFQVQAYDSSLNAMDFYYAYSLTGTKNYWKGSWGPLQRDMTMPSSGWYASPTFTSSGSITITVETMH
jgi:hypothetical protein